MHVEPVEYCPAAQDMQIDCPAELNLPAAHAAQVDRPAAVLNVPEGQTAQMAEKLSLMTYRPAAHAEQTVTEVCPVPLVALPAGQNRQSAMSREPTVLL